MQEQAYLAGAPAVMHDRGVSCELQSRVATREVSSRRLSSWHVAFRRVGPLHANARITFRLQTVKRFLEDPATVAV